MVLFWFVFCFGTQPRVTLFELSSLVNPVKSINLLLASQISLPLQKELLVFYLVLRVLENLFKWYFCDYLHCWEFQCCFSLQCTSSSVLQTCSIPYPFCSKEILFTGINCKENPRGACTMKEKTLSHVSWLYHNQEQCKNSRPHAWKSHWNVVLSREEGTFKIKSSENRCVCISLHIFCSYILYFILMNTYMLHVIFSVCKYGLLDCSTND